MGSSVAMSLRHIVTILCLTVSAAQSQVPPKVTGVSVSKAVKDGKPTLMVTWTALQNVANLLEYRVQYKHNGTLSWGYTVSAQPYSTYTLLSALLPGTEYNVRVRAVSAAGEGEWSGVLTETTYDIPPRITGVSLSKEVHKRKPSLKVTWTALPLSLVSFYEIQHKIKDTSWEHQVDIQPYSQSYFLPNLVPGTAYNVRMRAVYGAENGEWSDVHTETTFDIPSRVMNVSVTTSVEDRNLTLTVSWTIPQSELPITDYEVEYRRSGTTSWINSTRLSVSPPANSTTLTGLDAGVEYVVRVKALSEIGAGAWSEEQMVTPSDNNCLGSGFTQTIPARQEWSQYSTTVLKPGDAAVYLSLSFACNGTLQSLTIPSVFRGSIYRYWNQYLYIVVSVWRFNDTGYYQVKEFQDRVKVTEHFQEVPESSVFWATVSIFPQMEVLAKDTLAFRLLLPHNSDLGPVYQHLRFLFKPGPSPGAFIPVVSGTFTASSGPVTDEADSTQSPANGTKNNILQNEGVIFGIFLAVCQVEVVLVAIATGLIVHFITKVRIKRNLTLSHDRSGKTAERGPERSDNRPLYESVGLGGSTGEHVEMQPSPAYQATSKPEYLQQ